jgi:predicted MFS family arabinose efflux permease
VSTIEDTHRRRRAVVALCVTEITSWGALYYSLPVAAQSITGTEGWSATTVTAGFTVAVLSSAAAGVPVGRWLDRAGPRVVMTAGSVLGVCGLVLVAVSPSVPVFLLAWLVAGTAQAAVLYQPAFTAIARWYGDRRTRPLTVITLVAGLSSTVFAPLIAASLAAWGWRSTYLLLAAVIAAVTIPIHALLLTPRWPGVRREGTGGARRVASVTRSRRFLVLQLAMTLIALGLYAVTLSLIPLLTSRGIATATAATAFGLVGAGQVLGRLAFAALPTGSEPSRRTVTVGVSGTAGVALLAALPGPVIALMAAAVLAGAARGAHTLVQATAIADRWGTDRLGAINGVFAVPITIATAAAPVTCVVLAAELGSYTAAAAALTGVIVTGTVIGRRR